MHNKAIRIAVGTQHLNGTVAAPATGFPGILFLHGWGGSQERDLVRAQGLAALGSICLTFDMRGHAETEGQRDTVTREDNLQDVLAAYDSLISHPQVDSSCIAVVGSSYGGYLAALLTTLRPVRWLALRVPALYRDAQWLTPKQQLNRADLNEYRRTFVDPETNRALSGCRKFSGDVLVVESEHDDLVPHLAVASYTSAFIRARSMTFRVIEGADHALTEERHRRAYDALLTRWVREMVLGAR
ncbi:permease [Agaricicola taiwanensis]|uniref:Permease n=1 Tax=Agaricicola taiwanensis TaxID=591372 RepID=A0A8J2YM09_9RHOB|nr:alpha/beta fold hydrolase [Agaricicola taiwanensis]GGE51188.1 permease [Agaricicola taiwanensis]